MRLAAFRMERLPAWIVLGLAFLWFDAGCGKRDANRADVGGKVNLDGKPLEEGSITFTPAAGVKGTVAGGTIKNGCYRLTGKGGAAIGLNKVAIRSMQDTGETYQPYGPGTTASPKIVDRVARRFNVESVLTVDVKPEANTADFEVNAK
jgi:hypothetical protein